MRLTHSVRLALFVGFHAAAARADDEEPSRKPPLRLSPWTDASTPAEAPPPRDVRDEVPRQAFTESPFQLSRGAALVSGTATEVPTRDGTQASGGFRLGAGLFPRVAGHVLLARSARDRWAPSASVHVRALGSGTRGGALGVLATYKAEGFGELGGEGELGLTLGYRAHRAYLDGNAIVGRGLEAEEEGETDGEVRLRGGISPSSSVQLGVDGELRRRFAGRALAPNGRAWDAHGGPQIAAAWGGVVLAATCGVTNATPDGASAPFGVLTLSAIERLF